MNPKIDKSSSKLYIQKQELPRTRIVSKTFPWKQTENTRIEEEKDQGNGIKISNQSETVSNVSRNFTLVQALKFTNINKKKKENAYKSSKV